MKRILLLLSVSVGLMSGAVGQQPAGLGTGGVPRYTIKGEGFSVELLSRPTYTTTKVSRKDGSERTKRSLTTTTNSIVFSIDIFENLKPRQSLEEFIAESNASSQYDPTAERNLSVDGFPGKEYSSQTKTTTTVTQFLATKDRLFRFAATGPASAESEMKYFLSSIKLGEKTGGIDVSAEIYTGKEVDIKARLLTKPEPTYTKDARDNKVEGTVVLRAILSKTGRVENIRVVVALPNGLTEQAIRAAREILFVPAMKDGKAVSMWIQLEYNFSL